MSRKATPPNPKHTSYRQSRDQNDRSDRKPSTRPQEHALCLSALCRKRHLHYTKKPSILLPLCSLRHSSYPLSRLSHSPPSSRRSNPYVYFPSDTLILLSEWNNSTEITAEGLTNEIHMRLLYGNVETWRVALRDNGGELQLGEIIHRLTDIRLSAGFRSDAH